MKLVNSLSSVLDSEAYDTTHSGWCRQVDWIGVAAATNWRTDAAVLQSWFCEVHKGKHSCIWNVRSVVYRKIVFVATFASTFACVWMYTLRLLGTFYVYCRFVINSEVHDYNTRLSQNLHLFNTRTSYGQRCIKYKGSSLWNSLPMPLRLCSSIAVSKRHVKNYLRTLWHSKC